MKTQFFLILAVLLIVSTASFAQSNGITHKVSTVSELKDAVNKVKSGETIIIADGEYKNTVIDVKAIGTQDKKIVITAEHTGKAVFSGLSSVTLSGKHIVFSGVAFKNGAPENTNGAILIFGEHNRVTNTEITAFNESEKKWVGIYGKFIEVDHNIFQGKNTSGTLMVVWRDIQSPNNFVRIHHNYFKDYSNPNNESNGLEAIRIGTSTDSQTDSYTIVENNRFENMHGEIELISIKSGRNAIRGNSIIASTSAITSRHGKNNLIENNVFLSNFTPNSIGIRAYDRGHIIRNNYIDGVNTTSNSRAGILVQGGNNKIGYENESLNAQWTGNNILVENNTIYQSLQSFSYDDKNEIPPGNITFKNNVVFTDKGAVIREAIAPGIQNSVWQNELYYGSKGFSNKSMNVPNGVTFTADPANVPLTPNEDGLFLHKTNGAQNVRIVKVDEVGPKQEIMQTEQLNEAFFKQPFINWYFNTLALEKSGKPAEGDAEAFGVVETANDKKSAVVNEAHPTKFLPTDDTFVDIETKYSKNSTSEYIRIKNNAKRDKGRIAYLRFALDPAAIQNASKIFFTLTARISATSNPNPLENVFNVYMLHDFKNWQEGSLHWMNSPNHEEKSVTYVAKPFNKAVKAGIITIKGGHNETAHYQIDITAAAKQSKDGIFTLMIMEEEGKGYNIDPYAMNTGKNTADAIFQPFIELK